jgi:hypothetical protein
MEHICFLCEFEKQFETGAVDEVLGKIEKNRAINTIKLARERGKAVWVFCEEVFDKDGGCVLVVIRFQLLPSRPRALVEDGRDFKQYSSDEREKDDCILLVD